VAALRSWSTCRLANNRLTLLARPGYGRTALAAQCVGPWDIVKREYRFAQLGVERRFLAYSDAECWKKTHGK